MRRLACLTAVVIAVVSGPATVAAATSGLEASRALGAVTPGDGKVELGSEVLALVELGAFPDPPTARLTSIHDEYRSSLTGIDHDGLVTWVEEADAKGAAVLSALRAQGWSIPAQLAATLGPLSGDDRDRLATGRPISVSAGVYTDALAQLDQMAAGGSLDSPGATVAPIGSAADVNQTVGAVPARAGAGAPVPGTGGRPLSGSVSTTAPEPVTTAAPAPSTTPTSTSATATTAAAGRDPRVVVRNAAAPRARPSGVPVWVWGLVAGAAALAVAALVVARRARRDAVAGTDDEALSALLDAARRLNAAADSNEVVALAVDEAVALTGSVSGAYVAASAGSAVLQHESTAGTVQADQLDRSVIRRVLETGHPVRSVVSDPALGAVSQAVLAVAVLRSGQVVGCLALVRAAEEPFAPAQQDLVCRWAPLVGGALDSVGARDDITEQSLTDGLTALANRRRLDRDLPALLADGRSSVGFLMIDVDHFKTYNDLNGHVAGDAALCLVADVLRANVRPGDVVYRYGGEEFCVLLGDADRADAEMVGERVRAAVEATEFAGGSSQPGGRVTISVGVALTERSDAAEIKERADGALYDAKHRGRNRVEVAAL